MDAVFLGGAAYVRGAALNLELTLMLSAQTFCWRKREDAYYGAIGGRPIKASYVADAICFSPCDEAFFPQVARYFDLHTDYEALEREFSWFFAAEEMFASLGGLRVLNQPPFDALIMFILSANNNASRIRNLTLALSDAFGEVLTLEGFSYHAMPTPESLSKAGEAKLRALGCGYRDKYLVNSARRVCEGFELSSLSGLSYEDAHARLVTLPGVGGKVADCVQLFSLGHTMAFPVDTWVERLLLNWFLSEFSNMSRARMAQKARALFGERAGVFQQFLFHSARTGLVELSVDS